MKVLPKLLKAAGLTLALAISLALPASLDAEGPAETQLGITPLEHPGTYFDLKLIPGETTDLKVEIGNFGSEAVAARTYSADTYTIINGGFGARLNGESSSGTTSWLSYESLTVTLPAGDGLQRTFTLTVPPNTPPGEYITSLVVENAEPVASEGGGIALLQVQRKAIGVAITVMDPSLSGSVQPEGSGNGGLFVRHPDLIIGAAEHKYVATSSVVAVQLANEGNVHLRPSGEFRLYDGRGQEVTRFPVIMGTFYAGTSTTIEVPFTDALLPGAYVARLTLDYEGGTAAATNVALDIPEATTAESQGAPTGSEGRATANQAATSGGHLLTSWWLLLGGAVGLTVLGYAATRRLRGRAGAQSQVLGSRAFPRPSTLVIEKPVTAEGSESDAHLPPSRAIHPAGDATGAELYTASIGAEGRTSTRRTAPSASNSFPISMVLLGGAIAAIAAILGSDVMRQFLRRFPRSGS